ncbi:hypothetical protein, partial [Weizmannia acidilactici]
VGYMEHTYGNYPQTSGLGHFGSYAGGGQPYYDDDMDMMHHGTMGQTGMMGPMGSGTIGTTGGMVQQYPSSGQMYPGQYMGTSMSPSFYGMPGYGHHMGMPMYPGQMGGYGTPGTMAGFTPGYSGMGMGPSMMQPMQGYYPGMAGRDCDC